MLFEQLSKRKLSSSILYRILYISGMLERKVNISFSERLKWKRLKWKFLFRVDKETELKFCSIINVIVLFSEINYSQITDLPNI